MKKFPVVYKEENYKVEIEKYSASEYIIIVYEPKYFGRIFFQRVYTMFKGVFLVNEGDFDFIDLATKAVKEYVDNHKLKKERREVLKEDLKNWDGIIKD